jgi:heterodisulfide reductase subunit A2
MVDREHKKTKTRQIGSVMVVGAGISGIQASLDLADSGYKVYLVEKSPAIGGIMTQLDKTFPTNDCAMCIVSPKLVDCARHINVNLLTNTDVEEISGKPGNFKIKLKCRTRYIDESKCSGCGDCALECPVTRQNEFDQGLAERKAVYRPFPQATPNVFTIDKKGKSPCSEACPAGCNAYGYVALIRMRKFKEAIELIREKIPLPAICGRVCGFCEDECNRANVDENVRIRALKRFAADYEMNHRDSTEDRKIQNGITHNKEKIAIIGSGPSGLTAAYDLAGLGYQPVIFEALNKAGGMLRVGIPEYRLPDDILDYEIDIIRKAGVEIKTQQAMGSDLTLKDLFHRGFKAVFIAVGTHKSHFLGIEGETINGIYPGLEFLKDVNTSPSAETVKNKVIAVIGGGNTALDTVRCALRLGARKAFIVYRRSREQMPVSMDELESAEAEGIIIHYLLSPFRIEGNHRGVTKLICNKMKLGSPDSSGRRRPLPIEGETQSFNVDMVMPALGQTVDYSQLNEADCSLETERGLIKINPDTLETNISGVFAGGDAAGSGGYVVHAIAHGHRAAITIDNYTRGRDLLQGQNREEIPTAEMPAFPEEKTALPEIPQQSVKQRINNFREIELSFNEDQAVREAGRCLDCGSCCECLQCEKACEANAIDHNMRDKTVELNTGAIILSPGSELSDLTRLHRLGYGKHTDVITSLQFERILSASGPYSGHIQRPSDAEKPERIAFIQCAGSRDNENDYCSAVCCMYALKEAIIAMEHEPDIHCTIFYMDIRAYGKGFEAYYERAKDLGINFIRCRPQAIEKIPDSTKLRIGYTDDEGYYKIKEFDLVVLSAGFKSLSGANEIARKFGIQLDKYGFAETQPLDVVSSSRKGIYVSGTFSEPKDIPESVMEGSSAASAVMVQLAETRGTEVRSLELPPETDITGEPQRIGVFVCHCGKNIGGIVDVPSIKEYAETLPHVIYADDNIYTCSSDTQMIIKEKIKEHNLNRVVVASCSPRTHEALFQQTIREAGLNLYLFEMANIRDQCSWVHMHEKIAATEKSKDLVRMAVAKAGLAEPLRSIPLKVIQKALIVGGGTAGMTAALSIADQGYEVFLIEKNKYLGGIALRIDRNIEGSNISLFMKELIEKVLNHKLIRIYTDSRLIKVDGFIGNFTSTIRSRSGKTQEIEHGVAIIAAGGLESKPDEYLYGKNSNVKTLLELSEAITDTNFKVPDTVVMIQCVGSREAEHMYCSRVCCSGAIKNAIRMKEKKPDTNIFILYRDIRTYGFKEKYYTRAREMGIIFIRYNPENKPLVTQKGKSLSVKVRDHILAADIEISPDLLVLSSRINPNPDNEEISRLFKLPLNSDKFFLEAHVKLKPVEFATDGVYLCGLSHYPKNIKETISQSRAAAGRAATVLSRETIESAGRISYIIESRCSACAECVSVCAFNAITIDEERKTAVINEVLCKGCGACASTCRGTAIKLHGFEDEQILKVLNSV